MSRIEELPEEMRSVVKEWLARCCVDYDTKCGYYSEHTFEGRSMYRYLTGDKKWLRVANEEPEDLI